MTTPLIITPLPNIPLIKPGDHLGTIILSSFRNGQVALQDGDVFVIAQKIVSKSEDRLVNLTEVHPGKMAEELAREVQKDPRFVELVLQESTSVIRKKPGTLVVEHKLGFICANAGIDHSNVEGPWGNADDWVLLLPKDPDQSASQFRQYIKEETGKDTGILIIDSHGRAWRNGTTGITIGTSGVPGIVDMRGKADLFGFRLKVTQIAAADELAAAASLMMGQAKEGYPIVHVRGFPYPLRESSLEELIRPREQDLFR